MDRPENQKIDPNKIIQEATQGNKETENKRIKEH